MQREQHKIEFTSPSGNRTEYVFRPSGKITDSESIESGDTVTEEKADGVVLAQGKSDTYWYTGGVEYLDVDGDATVTIDGIDVSSESEQTIEFKSIDGRRTDYSFIAQDSITGWSSKESSDSVSGSEVNGTVFAEGKSDYFDFTGGIQHLDVSDGPARVFVDGQMISGAPRSYTKLGNSRGTVELAIYSSYKLVQNNGRVPEEQAALYAKEAFDTADYNYEITWNHPTPNPPQESTDMGDGTLSWWSDESVEREAPDAAMLLTNANGGGLTYIGQQRGIMAMGEVSSDTEWKSSGSSAQIQNTHGFLHEVGHALGLPKDADKSEPGRQHWGDAWISWDDMFHRTPCVTGNDAYNVCGEWIPDRGGRERVFHMLYHDCAIQNFQVT